MSTPQTIRADVVLVPAQLPSGLDEKAVVVFDVLRATTSMTAALAAGVSEIRIYPDTAAARAGGTAHGGPQILCGEEKCLAPAGFDLGNSPGAFTAKHAGHTMFMSTTNGTRALVAARNARLLLAGALLNASAVARKLASARLEVLLLCAGTGGKVAIEDVLGAGAVLGALERLGPLELTSDTARLAKTLFASNVGRLHELLREGTGGQNIIAAGLEEDIAFCARLDVYDLVGIVHDDPLRVVRA